MAASKGQDGVLKLLLERGADPNLQDNARSLFAHQQWQRCHVLLQHSPSTHTPSRPHSRLPRATNTQVYGVAPLHLATLLSGKAAARCIKLLVQHGADVSLKTKARRDCRSLRSCGGLLRLLGPVYPGAHRRISRWDACVTMRPSLPCPQSLRLSQGGAFEREKAWEEFMPGGPVFPTDGDTPLHFAAGFGSVAAIRALLRAGADLTALNQARLHPPCTRPAPALRPSNARPQHGRKLRTLKLREGAVCLLLLSSPSRSQPTPAPRFHHVRTCIRYLSVPACPYPQLGQQPIHSFEKMYNRRSGLDPSEIDEQDMEEVFWERLPKGLKALLAAGADPNARAREDHRIRVASPP